MVLRSMKIASLTTLNFTALNLFSQLMYGVFRSKSDFSDLHTSIKDVFNVIECVYRYSFGVNAIIN